MISELYAENRAIEALAAQLLRIVVAAVPDTAAVAGLRWRIAQAMIDHCRREDRLVYEPLLAADDVMAGGVAERLRDQRRALGPAFAGYIAGWPVGRIGREWQGFGAETAALMAELAAQIERSEALLYPHAERLAAPRAAAA